MKYPRNLRKVVWLIWNGSRKTANSRKYPRRKKSLKPEFRGDLRKWWNILETARKPLWKRRLHLVEMECLSRRQRKGESMLSKIVLEREKELVKELRRNRPADWVDALAAVPGNRFQPVPEKGGITCNSDRTGKTGTETAAEPGLSPEEGCKRVRAGRLSD